MSPICAVRASGACIVHNDKSKQAESFIFAPVAAPGPIKGQVNRVWDAFAGEMRVGRFGWKANVATLAH